MYLHLWYRVSHTSQHIWATALLQLSMMDPWSTQVSQSRDLSHSGATVMLSHHHWSVLVLESRSIIFSPNPISYPRPLLLAIVDTHWVLHVHHRAPHGWSYLGKAWRHQLFIPVSTSPYAWPYLKASPVLKVFARWKNLHQPRGTHHQRENKRFLVSWTWAGRYSPTC